MMEELTQLISESRYKNFKAILKKERDEIYLSITHNGYQSSAIALNHREMKIVVELLTKELENNEDLSAESENSED